MATTVTKVVDPNSGSGYDYASLSLWEAGQQGDLTGVRDEIAVAKCRCTGGTADTTAVTVDGWTTSATQYIKIWTDPSEDYRHNGTYQTGNKYRLENNGRNIYGSIHFDDLYGIIDGISVKPYLALNATYGVGIGVGYYTTSVVVKNCVITCNLGAYSTTWWAGIETETTGTLYAINNIIYDIYYSLGTDAYIRGIHAEGSNLGKLYCYNNTIQHCNIGLSNGYGAGFSFIAKNCGIADCDIGVSANVTQTTCSSTTPTFVNAGADDFHLASNDTTWIGAATNLYNDAAYPFQTDIDGQDRGGSGAQWDIGADEYVAAGGSSIVPLLLHQYRARRQ